MLVPARRLDPEIMDRPDNPPEDLHGALSDIHRVNRWLGGSKVILDAVRPFLETLPGGATLSILDVGTGGADLPLDLAEEARRLGRSIRIVGLDRDPVTVDYARRRVAGTPEVTVLQGDALDLPFEAGSFDLVTASLFLHHFGHGDAVRLLSGFRRVARRAVLINDLRRHVVPWAFIGVAARLTRRHPMFVHDAPLSVLRGFTESELARAALESGAGSARVEPRFPYRLLLTLSAQGLEP